MSADCGWVIDLAVLAGMLLALATFMWWDAERRLKQTLEKNRE